MVTTVFVNLNIFHWNKFVFCSTFLLNGFCDHNSLIHFAVKFGHSLISVNNYVYQHFTVFNLFKQQLKNLLKLCWTSQNKTLIIEVRKDKTQIILCSDQNEWLDMISHIPITFYCPWLAIRPHYIQDPQAFAGLKNFHSIFTF